MNLKNIFKIIVHNNLITYKNLQENKLSIFLINNNIKHRMIIKYHMNSFEKAIYQSKIIKIMKFLFKNNNKISMINYSLIIRAKTINLIKKTIIIFK